MATQQTDVGEVSVSTGSCVASPPPPWTPGQLLWDGREKQDLMGRGGRITGLGNNSRGLRASS